MIMFELSKFQILVNKCFKTTLQFSLSVIQLDNFSSTQKQFSHIKTVNEMTDKDDQTFPEGSEHSLLEIQLRNERRG